MPPKVAKQTPKKPVKTASPSQFTRQLTHRHLLFHRLFLIYTTADGKPDFDTIAKLTGITNEKQLKNRFYEVRSWMTDVNALNIDGSSLLDEATFNKSKRGRPAKVKGKGNNDGLESADDKGEQASQDEKQPPKKRARTAEQTPVKDEELKQEAVEDLYRDTSVVPGTADAVKAEE